MGNFARMRYDLGAFEKTAKLGPVIAANYFVSN
jgi:phosphatidylethanolamine-binding protein